MQKKIDYQEVINKHLQTLKDLQAPSGLFRASGVDVDTGYDKAWLRDNFYECLAFMVLEDWEVVRKTYEALLTIFVKHEWKIDHAIAKKPEFKHHYIHARYHPETFDEFWEDWGNKQNDAVGAILFMLGELEYIHKINILDSEDRKRVVQKLVDYLQSLRYWEDPDSGVWEEDEEVHASSVGSCLAGLRSINRLEYINVNEELINKGQEALDKLLPRESEKKFVDLALLTLIYPYNVVTAEQRDKILENVEYHLVKDMGVVRYKNDYYYNKNMDGRSEEAEWTFGFSWLALIYSRMGNKDKARQFMNLSFKTINDQEEIPELYFSNTDEYNANSPLGWSESMFVIALHNFQKQDYKL
jgi:phosphorylase kinase alpha/beta subunit